MILVVAVPHLIALILLIVLFGFKSHNPPTTSLVTNENTDNEDNTPIFPNVENNDVTSSDYYIPAGKIKRRKRMHCPTCPDPTIFRKGNCPVPELTTNYRSVAALNEIIFVDDPKDNEYRYRCTGVIVDNNSFVTSAECVNDETRSTDQLQIVAGSRYWSKGSYHSVESVTKSDDGKIVLMKVNVPFPDIPTIAHVKFSTETAPSIHSGVEIKWLDSVLMDYHHRYKLGEVTSRKVSLGTSCKNCTSDFCIIENFNLQSPCSISYSTSGNPIFDEDNNLLAIQTNSFCYYDKGLIETCYNSIQKYAHLFANNATNET